MPDNPHRGAPYTVGGIPPYGFTRTPPYNDKWNVSGDVGLYERLDFDSAAAGSEAQRSLTNPPFLAVGGVAVPGRTPAWMQDDNGVKRILRGYIRRDDPYPFSAGKQLSDSDKASNARLYFMYNPTSVTRTYAALDQQTAYLNPTGSDSTALAAPFMAAADFELFFDRQQEVATLDDHPGCLLDLQVFDLLVGNGMGSGMGTRDKYDDALDRFIGPLPTQDAITVPNADDVAQTSLTFNSGLMLVVTIAPNLAFRGSLTSAQAIFEKFSHRMTPVRMTLLLSLRLFSVGQEPKIAYRTTSAADMASADALREKADPNQTPESAQQAAEANEAGRLLALGWARHWADGQPHPVMYSHEKRCEHPENDDLIDVDPPHVPTGFDCATLTSRAFKVAGLSDALKLTACSDTSVYVKLAKDRMKQGNTIGEGHPWDVVWISFAGSSGSGFESALAKFLEPGVVLIRDGHGGMGHAAFINQDLGGGDDKGHRFEILHAPAPGKLVVTYNATVEDIMKGSSGRQPFDYAMKAAPLKYDKNAVAPRSGAS